MTVILSACGGFTPEPIWQRDVVPERPGGGVQKPGSPEANPSKTEFEITYDEVHRKVFQPYCLRCHNPQNKKGGVDLSSLPVMLGQGGLLVPGQPSESLVYRVIAGGQMPPRGALSAELQESVRLWIESGNSRH